MKPHFPISHPPSAFRRARLDNLTLVPGSVFAAIARCQELANDLPRGGVLIVVPTNNPKQKGALLAVAKLVAQEGHQVRVIPATELSRRHLHKGACSTSSKLSSALRLVTP